MQINIEKIREIRKLKKITQLELAKMCGIKRTAYVNWEKGTRKPGLDDVLKIAYALNIPPTELKNIILEDKNSYFLKCINYFLGVNYDLTKKIGSIFSKETGTYNIKISDSPETVEKKVLFTVLEKNYPDILKYIQLLGNVNNENDMEYYLTRLRELNDELYNAVLNQSLKENN